MAWYWWITFLVAYGSIGGMALFVYERMFGISPEVETPVAVAAVFFFWPLCLLVLILYHFCFTLPLLVHYLFGELMFWISYWIAKWKRKDN
ncbi:MAG: hypothetical protein Q7S83_00135 [bacterium]|nr:hypothetical protein [bacterium]